jgi:hypothetical protein
MRRILPGSILSYNQYGHLKVPKAVKCECPECGKTTAFILKVNYQSNRVGLFSQGNCPVCRTTSQFVIMLKDYFDGTNEQADVFIYDQRQPLHQIEKNTHIPGDLIRAYRSALNVHQSKDPSATAVMSKRVLESVLKSFLGEDTKGLPMSERWEELPTSIDLTKPISALSHLIHPESHFQQMLELERDLDDEMAELLMDLLNGLIEYLYVLPARLELTHGRIEEKL